MLLSNIQDNIGKVPMLAAAQSAARQQGEVEAQARRTEELERARQAEEMTRELHESENEAVRGGEARPHEIHPDEKWRGGRRRPARRPAAPEAAEKASPAEPSPPAPRPGDGHVVDITV
ncbi:MAG: hypothetical protein V1918_08805 [Planctomycetota bacterium]